MKTLFLIAILLILSSQARQDSVEQLINKMKNNIQDKEEIKQMHIGGGQFSVQNTEHQRNEKINDSTINSIFFTMVNQTQYNNVSNVSNTTYSTNLTNSSYPYSYNYSYPQQTTNTNFYSYSNVSNVSNTTNLTNLTNSSYPYSYNYSYPQQTANTNYYTYSNVSNVSNTTNLTNLTNSSYPYSYNYSYPQQTTNTNYYTYSNVSNVSNINSTTNLSTSAKQRLQQSKISLKLRNQEIVTQQNNTTQTVMFYNQSMQSYQQIVIFNQTDLYKPKSNNNSTYYYYNDNELITLEKVYDSNGNTIFRNATLQFSFVVYKPPLGNTYSYGYNNNVFYGTLIQSSSGIQANYKYQNEKMNQDGLQQFDNYTYQDHKISGKGEISYYNGQGEAQLNKSSSEIQQQQEKIYQNNESGNWQQMNQNFNSQSNVQQLNGEIDRNNHSSSSSKLQDQVNSQNQNTQTQYNTNGITNFNSSSSYSSQNIESVSQQSQQNGEYQKTQTSNQSNLFKTEQMNGQQDGTLSIQNKTINQQSFYNTLNSTTYSNENSSYYQSQQSNKANTIHANVNDVSNSTSSENIYNVTINNISSEKQLDQQIKEGVVNQSFNSSVTNVFNQTNIDSVDSESETLSTIDSQATQINREQSQLGNNPIVSNTQSTSSEFQKTFEFPKQQFNQLRGSKRQAAGSWKQLDENNFSNSNQLVIEEAINEVNTKFNPQKEGFEFDSIISVHEQLVAGFNYNIKLKYLNNQLEQQIYEVIIYSIPWTNKQDEITSCTRFDQEK